ncbi:hypothetical protein CWI42_012070 [Ordospora colligata]|uniref:Uncharacterized protein n=1 Tax=Ordospora colligata OC4 TaxID=1354746 RepID=A0A0B2UHJ1_9MICR|nr:uncharacterized protein M896_012070 [Ordospora colligata OC4]KHN70551.1 hypothetical protein M896_012070 [Ordospora colligata OC4]TBU17301.1 hypothetical protein CWI41_012070 [Ordospora colligata]TBU17551.1 hypothetical protein CWI40_012070 [Ordospora colligata]TBU19731.1 hypothetical protein CWI42_012070 [Ordospora colligata]
MKSRLEELLFKLKSDPSVMHEIECEVEKYINHPDLSPVKALLASNTMEAVFYALKVVEQRIKAKKMAGVSLRDEAEFMKDTVKDVKTRKSAQVFALLGLYEWPNEFPEFFSIIIDFLSYGDKMGYMVLDNFMYLCNYSQEINEERKSELKKGCAVMANAYMPLFDDSHAEHIIPILTESLKMMPKTFDCGIVLRRGAEFPNKTIEFLCDGMSMFDLGDVVELISKMEVCQGVIMCLNGLKDKAPKIRNLCKMYDYVFKGLRKDVYTFGASIEFWTKLFGQGSSPELVAEVLTEVVSIYLSIDEYQRQEVEGEVYGVFNVVCKNYPKCAVEFLSMNGDYIGRKLALHFVRKVFGAPGAELMTDGHELKFKDPVVCCGLALCNKDFSAVEYIQYFDLNEKEPCKLIISILEMFELSDEQLKHILGQCDVKDKTYANDVIAECLMKLGQEEQFSGEWTHDELMRLFFYLKKRPGNFQQYANAYFEVFLKREPFDRCFAILKMFGSIPSEVLQRMYFGIDTYMLKDLGCFNRDLLGYIDEQRLFIRKEVARLVNEWKEIEDPEDLVSCTKSLVQAIRYSMARFKSKHMMYPCIDELVEILQIDDPGVVRKVSETFSICPNNFDTFRAVYLFVLSYNSGALESTHPSIVASLAICIVQEDGAKAFAEVLGIDLQKCINLRKDVMKSPTRRSQALIRVFLQDYKGKPLNSLYANTFKVEGQHFFKKTAKNEANATEFEISRSFFESEIQ